MQNMEKLIVEIKTWWGFRPLKTKHGETIPGTPYNNVDEWSVAFAEILSSHTPPKEATAGLEKDLRTVFGGALLTYELRSRPDGNTAPTREQDMWLVCYQTARTLEAAVMEVVSSYHPTPDKPQEDEGLREALRSFIDTQKNSPMDDSYDSGFLAAVSHVEGLLDEHPKPTEPLACLAGKDGFNIKMFPPTCILDSWDIELARHKSGVLDSHEFKAPTYTAAESKAIKYLNGLADKKEGV